MKFEGMLEDQDGSSLISAAMSLPILFAFVFGWMQVCLAYYSYERTSEMAREGARYAAVRGSTCTSTGGTSCTVSASQVQTYVSGLGWPNLAGGTTTVVATYPDGNEAPGHRVQVVVSYSFPWKIPWVATSPVAMGSTSVMRIIM